MDKVKHSTRTTLPRRKRMEDVRSRPGGRWEKLVTRSSWTLRGGVHRKVYLLGPRVTIEPSAARARRHVLR